MASPLCSSYALLALKGNEGLDVIEEYIASGVVKPVIDERYPLSETAGAFRRLGAGWAKGKLVVVMDPADGAT